METEAAEGGDVGIRELSKRPGNIKDGHPSNVFYEQNGGGERPTFDRGEPAAQLAVRCVASVKEDVSNQRGAEQSKLPKLKKLD